MIEQMTLGDLVNHAPAERAGDSDYAVLSMTRTGGLVPQTSIFKKVIASRDLANYKVVRPNQLVVGIHIDEGALGFSGPDQQGIVSPAYTLWNLRNPRAVHTPYLHRFIRSDRAVAYFISKYRETAERRGKLTREQFLALEIPLPPLAEQKRISTILDAVDALRVKRRETLAQLDSLTQAIFREMFDKSDEVTESSTKHAAWGSEPVARLCAASRYACVGGPFGSELTQADYVDSPGVPVIRGQNLTSSTPYFDEESFVYVSDAKAKTLEPNQALPGDVIVSQRGARLAGQVACIPPTARHQKYIVSQSQMKITPDLAKLDPIYLVSFFRSPSAIRRMESRIISTGVPHINLGILRKFPVLIPPLTLQLEFARRVAAVEQLRSAQSASLGQLDKLFASVQHRAFRGEL